MSGVRVLLVDDHPVVRAGLRALLASHDDVLVVAEAASGEEAVASAMSTKPDVVLMDLRLGDGIDGAQATAQIVAASDPPRVVVLTTYDTDADILRAVEAGAAGYLLKDTDPEVLIESVFAAARGETVLDPDVARRLYRRMQRPPADLSAREVEVLSLVAKGLSNRAIAKQLVVSEATVKSHLVHAFTKLDVDNRTAAVVAARERGQII
ncbi:MULTISPECIES: response regulator [Gordonia]|uniref:Putative NarL family two-component response regulator n=1 Tax=Gordonia alkanivorans NBRC 16433 TaxID=1027371 RepID=F9VYG1_9ACTN|nr:MULTISPECIES: response regulator transcription factor [Gordonia]MDH3008567.1 response regulator transcription factor [Gordonia alkanivorans]MDH3017747.1 response regulator transcription factor [Gordonia alkanivorans]MDH3021478.1 response regulator transcription factor [Gordonia alkanivorans]MDH3025283.1 response regulator transcription factor [Gordonia alkanivorans]MDH3043096.1 response regulator transcription factor [Gordonia alkanivorans]